MSRDDAILGLLGRYTDGAATAAEVAELNAAMRADAGLRRAYLEYMTVDAALAAASTSWPHAHRPFRRVAVGAVAAAAVAAAALAAVLWRRDPPPAATPAPFATLVAAHDAVWGDPNVELALNGGHLPEGSIRLESGTAEFLTADGATVALHAPASARFPAPKRVFVEEGRVFCRCPSPESRIVVETPVTEVTDLGTEFAVEARADRTARVAVLSGEVRVGTARQQLLRKGEAADVRGDGLVVVRPLGPGETAELHRIAPWAGGEAPAGPNRLRDPGFDLGGGAAPWGGTATNIVADPRGRSGGAVRVFAHGYAEWPQCRQKVATGDIAGKLVVATVWAATPADDVLRPGQFAMLKVAFVNGHGREFGFVKRHLLNADATPGRFESARLAAFAPPGTTSVQCQLILHAHTHGAGSVLFDDAGLVIADPPAP